jgi:predicted GIY-YIG superfamily endonuclease
MAFNQTCYALLPKGDLDNDFLFYALKGTIAEMRALTYGTVFETITTKTFDHWLVPLPPLPEQRAIAHVLGTLDDKIELNRRMSETLEAMARALFKAWFVDFLPVRAKMAAKANDPSLLLPQAEPGTWYVYAIECNDGSLYIGQTEDLRQRWLQHIGGKGASWTMQHPPVRVPYWEKQPSREAAVEREKWLKTGYGRKWLKQEIAARTQTGEPVRAKMEGRLPASAGQAGWQRGQSLPGLPAHLYDLFPDRLVDSELGPIPEGWKVGTLADLAVLNPEVWKTETRPAKVIYVDLSNTKRGRIDSLTAYDSADAPSRAQRVLRPGDTIVGTVRPGNGSYAFIAEGGLTGSTGFAVLRPRAAHYAEVVYLAATAPDNIDRLAHLADGAAYPAVRPEVVAATPVVCPGDEVLARFSQAAGPALAKIAQNERASRTLAALRDALLPKLIRGEIRVKDAERFLMERGL